MLFTQSCSAVPLWDYDIVQHRDILYFIQFSYDLYYSNNIVSQMFSYNLHCMLGDNNK